MYLDKAIEEDKSMVESWKAEADGLLIFVSLQTTSHTSAYDVETVDRSILCSGRGIACIVRPEYSAESTEHLKFLSCTYLPATFYYSARWLSASHSAEFVQPYRAILSAYVGRLGQRALVLKSGHQSDLRPIGDIATAVGTSLSKGCLPRLPTLQPPQASTYSCIF